LQLGGVLYRQAYTREDATTRSPRYERDYRDRETSALAVSALWLPRPVTRGAVPCGIAGSEQGPCVRYSEKF
jgi:hypothetical protein